MAKHLEGLCASSTCTFFLSSSPYFALLAHFLMLLVFLFADLAPDIRYYSALQSFCLPHDAMEKHHLESRIAGLQLGKKPKLWISKVITDRYWVIQKKLFT